VLDEQVANAGANARLSDGFLDALADVIAAASAGSDVQLFLFDHDVKNTPEKKAVGARLAGDWCTCGNRP
jgi:hypothetical protein